MTTQGAALARSPYCFKPRPYSSHSLLLAEFPHRGKGCRVLNAGCAGGYLSEILARRGFKVVSIDWPDTPHPPTVEFAGADLDRHVAFYWALSPTVVMLGFVGMS